MSSPRRATDYAHPLCGRRVLVRTPGRVTIGRVLRVTRTDDGTVVRLEGDRREYPVADCAPIDDGTTTQNPCQRR